MPADIHPSALLLNWRELLCRTELTGLAREVAAGSAVDEFDDRHVLLAPAAASLVSEAVVKTLREALTKAAGRDFAVHFAARERRDDELTVTKVVETEKLKARRAMVEAFKSDPFVQKCVQKIGSEVIETSVRLLTFDEIKDFEANAWKYSRLVGSGPENAEKR